MSFCFLYNVVSENCSVQNFPWGGGGEGGLLPAQGLLEVLSIKFSLVEIKIPKIIVIKFLNDCNSYGRGIYAFDVLPKLKHILRNQMAKCINTTSPLTVAEHNILRKSVWTYD